MCSLLFSWWEQICSLTSPNLWGILCKYLSSLFQKYFSSTFLKQYTATAAKNSDSPFFVFRHGCNLLRARYGQRIRKLQNEFFLLRPSRWGWLLPNPSIGQIWRLSVLATISFSQRQQAAGFLLAFRNPKSSAEVKSYSLIKIAFWKPHGICIFRALKANSRSGAGWKSGKIGSRNRGGMWNHITSS